MNTVVGSYQFDINVKQMTIKQLEALRDACESTIKQKKACKWDDEFTSINMLADADGFDLCYVDENGQNHILTAYNFKVVPKGEHNDGD